MARLLRGRLSVVLVAGVFTAQTGCTKPPVRPVESPPSAPSLATIAGLGRTGVVGTWGTLEPRMVEPPKGWTGGFARGAVAGAGATVLGGLAVGAAPLGSGGRGGAIEIFWLLGWTAVGVAVAPVGALVGGVVGAAKAQPPEQVERGKAALVAAVAAADLPATIRDNTIRLGSERSWHTLVPMTGQGPEMGDHDVGTVLDIVIRHVGLEAPANAGTVPVGIDRDPELELRLEVDARLITVSNGTVLYTCTFQELGAARSFSGWAADDGSAFRDALRQGSEQITDQIVRALFPTPEAPAEPDRTGPTGRSKP